MQRAARLALSVGAFLSATSAGATDYTFNVPVRIENMGNATEAWVSCDIYQGTLASKRSIGFGRTDIHLTSGAYSGNVAVNVNAAPGYIATDADSWGCGLVYIWNMPDGTPFMRSLYTDERNGLYTRYTGQEVASSHLQEGGTLSH